MMQTLHTRTVRLEHRQFEIGYNTPVNGIYHIYSSADYFLELFGQGELRLPLADYVEDRRAGAYGPVVFPATETDFVLQAMARAVLGSPEEQAQLG